MITGKKTFQAFWSMLMEQLRRITIEGFKSIEEATVRLTPLTVVVGPNAAGKSNFISVFKMLAFMTTEGFQLFVAREGGASSLLHDGPKRTVQIRVEAEFCTDSAQTTYGMRLTRAAGDTLIFNEEYVEYHKEQFPKPQRVELQPSLRESRLIEESDAEPTAAVLLSMLRRCRVYQFHDTSAEARIRNKGNVSDNSYLRSDAGNLAAFLYMLQESQPDSYKRITATLRRIAPSFHAFVLEPDPVASDKIMLRWRGPNPDYTLGPHQLSDGFLRFAALATLFLQPAEYRCGLVIVDEPELGLHPAAISLLGAMCRSVIPDTQVILATQSVTLVNEFDLSSLVVVEHDGKKSSFNRPAGEAVETWLEDYSLGELWEKNVIGGRP